MVDWIDTFTRVDVVDWRAALVSLLLAFGLTQAIARIYVWTFSGLSYSKTLVQAMAMGSIITCMLMLAIGNSIAAGIGIAGGLSIIRFRTTMRDPRDMIFVFASLAAGIAAGLQAHVAAIAGTGVFALAALTLHFTAYGSRRHFDGLVRFAMPSSEVGDHAVGVVLKTHCESFVLVTLRKAAQGELMEHAYQISIPDPAARTRLVSALNDIDGLQDVTLLMQEPTLDL